MLSNKFQQRLLAEPEIESFNTESNDAGFHEKPPYTVRTNPVPTCKNP